MVEIKNTTYRDLLLACIATGIVFIFYMSGQEVEFANIPKTIMQNILDYKTLRRERVYIPDNYTGIPCNYTLNLPQEEIMAKIDSYEFPNIENYTSDLFPEIDDQNLPEHPVFVTAFSSNHFEEGLRGIHIFFNNVVNKTRTLIFYDLGLTKIQYNTVKRICRCDVRRFPFERYPPVIGILKGCPWKPIVIQLVAKEHPFVVWMDASIRFKTSKLDEVWQIAKSHGVLASISRYFPVAHQTSLLTLRFLNEIPCLFNSTPGFAAGFVVLYETSFIRKYFMLPWVSCALIRDCMMLYKDVVKTYSCLGESHYFHCHRYDQSMFNILMYRLFNKSIENHMLNRFRLMKIGN